MFVISMQAKLFDISICYVYECPVNVYNCPEIAFNGRLLYMILNF